MWWMREWVGVGEAEAGSEERASENNDNLSRRANQRLIRGDMPDLPLS